VNCAKVLPQPACAFKGGIPALANRHRRFAVFVGEMNDPHAGFRLIAKSYTDICRLPEHTV
jgi:hypothetical protein